MHFRMFLSETWSGILTLSGSPITKQQVQLQVQLSCLINPLNCANTLKTSHHVGQNSQNNLHVTSSVCVDHGQRTITAPVAFTTWYKCT